MKKIHKLQHVETNMVPQLQGQDNRSLGSASPPKKQQTNKIWFPLFCKLIDSKKKMNEKNRIISILLVLEQINCQL